MTDKRDPLTELFSNVQLTGLSNTRHQTKKESPLQFDLPEHTDSLESSTPPMRPKRPVRPPRLDPNETFESDIEIEEASSEEPVEAEEPVAVSESSPASEAPADSAVESPVIKEPQVNAKANALEQIQRQRQQIQIQQAIERQRQAVLAQQKQQGAVETAGSSSSSTSSRSSLADRLAKLNTPKREEVSAMDLFLAVVEEENQKKASQNAAPAAAAVPQSTSSVVSASASSGKDAPKSESNQPLMGNRLIQTLESMIQSNLPNLKSFHVASALDSFDRRLLKAIWTRYRIQFLMNGQLEYAVAALSVLDALETVEDGHLVAAYVETTASDYLIWVDLTHNRLLAAFADAGRYFAN